MGDIYIGFLVQFTVCSFTCCHILNVEKKVVTSSGVTDGRASVRCCTRVATMFSKMHKELAGNVARTGFFPLEGSHIYLNAFSCTVLSPPLPTVSVRLFLLLRRSSSLFLSLSPMLYYFASRLPHLAHVCAYSYRCT